MANENGPTPRCPECNHKAPAHGSHCRAGIDESRPMTSAERYGGFAVGETYGRADADIAPTRPAGVPDQADFGHVDLGINPKDIIGSTKTPLGLLPWTALVRVSRVFALGAKKYGPFNWRTPGKPVQHVTYCEAALRHLAAYLDGETIDPESGESHLAHAACGLLILLDAQAIGNSIDNRPIAGLASELMALKPQL
jgi:hypothetical protein